MQAWLTTIVGRVCLNMLRARRARREQLSDVYVPDPIVSFEDGTGPEEEALVADSVGLALLVVLDALSPTERLAFVLHDVFGVPFRRTSRGSGDCRSRWATRCPCCSTAGRSRDSAPRAAAGTSAARPPVRQVQERVEVLLDHGPRVGLEVTPLVLVDEPGGPYLRPARDRPELGALPVGQRPVEREELVVPVFAHAAASRPQSRYPSRAGYRPRSRRRRLFGDLCALQAEVRVGQDFPVS